MSEFYSPTPEELGLKLNPSFDAERKLRINRLREILSHEPFSPRELLIFLEREFPGLYESDAGVWEKYTIRQHTLMVMGQFEKYFGHGELPGGVDKGIFRLMLALHDIGKPEAIANGGKHLQHQYSYRIIRDFCDRFGISAKDKFLVLNLVANDPIGQFMNDETGKVDASKTRDRIEGGARLVQMDVEEYFKLRLIYYVSDAGSYTENAGGLKSLDDMFIFDEVNRRVQFSPLAQAKIDQLGFLR